MGLLRYSVYRRIPCRAEVGDSLSVVKAESLGESRSLDGFPYLMEGGIQDNVGEAQRTNRGVATRNRVREGFAFLSRCSNLCFLHKDYFHLICLKEVSSPETRYLRLQQAHLS